MARQLSHTPEIPILIARTPHARRIVLASCNHSRAVATVYVSLVIIAAIYVLQHFAITTDSLDLISADLPWRENKADFRT